MKSIGFVDFYIDEWHSNNYPQMIRNSTRGKEYAVTLAWDEITPDGKKGLERWCREQGVAKAKSIEQVVAECDCIVVLAPDNPEHHERLAEIPLRSGKPVYVDKTFAPTRAAAERMFSLAAKHNTPLMSSSALRFGSALQHAFKHDVAGKRVNFVSTNGPGLFRNYSVHQLEMLVMVLGVGAYRVMHCGTEIVSSMIIDYHDDRRGSILMGSDLPFRLYCNYGENKGLEVNEMSDFFERFIDAMLEFFEAGVSPIAPEETIEIMALYETGMNAIRKPDNWMNLP